MENKTIDDIPSFFRRLFIKFAASFYSTFEDENYEEAKKELVNDYFHRQKDWNEIKKKHGLWIQVICLIAMLLLLGYTIKNVNLLRNHPCYLCEDLGYFCVPPIDIGCPEIINCSDYLNQGSCEDDFCNAGIKYFDGFELSENDKVLVERNCSCFWNIETRKCFFNCSKEEIDFIK